VTEQREILERAKDELPCLLVLADRAARRGLI
jgi:hypothetical protein